MTEFIVINAVTLAILAAIFLGHFVTHLRKNREYRARLRARRFRRFESDPTSANGRFECHGATSGVVLRLDLEDAHDVGILDALRIVQDTPTLAVFLDDRDVEVALEQLQLLVSPRAFASLSMGEGRLVFEWKAPPDAKDTAMVEDHLTLDRHYGVLEGALLERDPVDTDQFALMRVAEGNHRIASTLAGRALLTLHPDSAQARTLLDARLGQDAPRPTVEALIGCVFDPRVLATHEVDQDEHIGFVQATIARSDTELGATLARRCIDTYGLDAVVAWRTTTSHARARRATLVRDQHTFACALLSSFRGSSDTEGFTHAYRALEPLILQGLRPPIASFEHTMGDLDGWSLEHVTAALEVPSHDGVYTYWARALPKVWSEALASRLEEVVASERLGARGLVAILDAATERDHVQLVAPTREVLEHLDGRDMDRANQRAVRKALDALEGRVEHARHAAGGRLMLSEDDNAGALSLSHQAREGDIEAVDEP